MDESFIRFLREPYAIGVQEHLFDGETWLGWENRRAVIPQ
jgi:hypothetical protein